MSHPPSTRLADFVAGTLKETTRDKCQQHLNDCEPCSSVVQRIEMTRSAMAEIKVAKAPELGWESIAARIHWSTSSEQRAKSRKATRKWRRPALAAALVGGVAAISLWSVAREGDKAANPIAAEVPSQTSETGADRVTSMATLLGGMITFAQGDVRVDGEPLRFDQVIASGTSLHAGEGGLVVQFGDKSAFHLGAHSSLEIRRLDSERIELVVEGLVDVDLTRREEGQEFVVVAGQSEVVVRGTAFRVEFVDQALGVHCTRGKVVVKNGDGMVPVPAGQALRAFGDAWDSATLQAAPIDKDAMQALDAAMTMPMLPAWSERDLLRSATTILEVSAPAKQGVAVDGAYVASGSFFLRTMRGRHQVAMVDDDGVLHSGEWVDGSDGERASLTLVARASDSPAAPTRSQVKGTRSLRSRQMLSALDTSKRTTRCVASLAKQGLLDGSFAVFAMGVTADGTQEYLNLKESNLSPVVVQCLRRAIDAEALPSGRATGFQFRLDF